MAQSDPHHDPARERRTVQSADPSLSRETNRRLTEELREQVGAESVEVPRDRPHREASEHARTTGAGSSLAGLRLLIGAITIVVGVTLLLTAANSGAWLVVVVALALDIAGLALVLHTVSGMVSARGKPSPELEARMGEEGVADPEGAMSELMDEYDEGRD